jgi:hypothetical protein
LRFLRGFVSGQQAPDQPMVAAVEASEYWRHQNQDVEGNGY